MPLQSYSLTQFTCTISFVTLTTNYQSHYPHKKNNGNYCRQHVFCSILPFTSQLFLCSGLSSGSLCLISFFPSCFSYLLPCFACLDNPFVLPQPLFIFAPHLHIQYIRPRPLVKIFCYALFFVLYKIFIIFFIHSEQNSIFLPLLKSIKNLHSSPNDHFSSFYCFLFCFTPFLFPHP